MSYLEFLQPGPQHTAENMRIALCHQQSPAALTTVQLLLWFRWRQQTISYSGIELETPSAIRYDEDDAIVGFV